MFRHKDSEIEVLKVKLETLNNDLEETKTLSDTKEQDIIALKTQLNQLQTTISDKNKTLSTLQKDLQKYQSLAGNSDDDLKEKVRKLEYINNNYSILIENHDQELKEKDEKIRNLEYVTNNYQNLMNDTKEELQNLQVSSENNSDLQQQNEKIAKLETATKNYTQVIRANNEVLHRKDEKITELTSENDNYTQIIADKQQLLMTQTEELTKLKGDMEQNQEKFTTLTADYEKLSLEHTTVLKQSEEGKKYKTSFKNAAKVYDSYNQISNLLNYTIGLKDTEQDAVNIYIYFVQKAHIDKLWEYVRVGLITNKDDEKFLSLQQFLYMVMEQFFTVNPRYEFTADTEGIDFNILEHELHESSKERFGVLGSIILKGYINKKTNNIMKMSLVTVK